MMTTNKILIDAFERISEEVHTTLDQLSTKDLIYQPTKNSNSIAWLVWHLSRVQDSQIADLIDGKQVWENGWYEKFKLPFDKQATGYGQNSKDVLKVQPSLDLLLGYYNQVHSRTVKYLAELKDSDYSKIVDTRWTPPVSLAARLISTISDDLQHIGQAAYIKGLLKDQKNKD